MFDSIQILLIIVISTLTVLLTIIGIALFHILKEFKVSLEKINEILSDTARITKSVAEPVEEASDFVMGLKKGVSFLKTVSKFFKEDKQKSLKGHPLLKQTQQVKRKFFTKNGKKLDKSS